MHLELVVSTCSSRNAEEDGGVSSSSCCGVRDGVT
jgi:hypothetical protein